MSPPRPSLNRAAGSWLRAVIAVALAVTLSLAGGAVPAHAADGVTATFLKTQDWGTGYGASYTIRNGGSTTVAGWTVEFDLPAGARVASLWEGTYTVSGQHVTVRNVAWNGTIAPGASASFGFNVQYSGDYAAPANCKVNGAPCDGSGGGDDTQAPTAPGNVRVTGTTSSTVTLAWNAATDNVGVAGYDVYRGTTLAGTTSATSLTVTGLSPDTSYTFTVRARDAAGNTSPASTAITARTQPGGGDPGTFRRIAYFTQWGIYGRGYLVKNVDTSGQAAKLTHLHYAFGNINEQGRCFEANQTGVGDAWADYQRRFGAGETVSGQADTYDQPLAGNFNQLRQLKAKYPNLKVMFSLGGWTWSKYFSNAALPANRQAFVASCIDMFIKGNLPKIGGEPQGGPGSAAGVFDGIDLDWEWPASEGNAGNVVRPEDKQNFTALVAEFRRQLDEYGATVGKRFELSAFLPADRAKIDAGFEPAIFNSLDYGTVQGYDLYGAWDPQTNHQSQLNCPAANPAPRKYCHADSMAAWLAKGAPASKITISVPAFGRGWTGVANANNGLYQNATGPAPGQWEAGIDDYKLMAGKPGTVYRDDVTGAVWKFDGATFWSYDDPALVRAKVAWAKQQGFGGVMMWSLDGDAGSALVDAMAS